MQIRYHTEERFPPIGKEVLVEVLREVFGPQPVQMVKAAPGPGVVCFVPPSKPINGGILAPTPMQVAKSPGHRYMLRAALMVSQEWEAEELLWGDRTLVFDIESHSVDDRWKMDPRDFFRLGQYAWGLDGTVKLTTDYNEMIHVIREADGVVGHNIHAFDLSVLFGQDSVEPLEMARDGKVFDTMVFANLAFPAPDTFTTRLGHTYRDAAKPTTALKWLGLDNLSFQLGLEGKIGDLKALAKKYGGFGSIPVDDPEFVEYAEQDVVAEQELTKRLLMMKTPDAYDWREQTSAAIDAQNSRNGFRVDIPAAQARADALTARKNEHLSWLEANYGFPTEGKMPWRSKPGKEAIMKLLADNGITPESRPDWMKTATNNVSLGGEVLIGLTEGTPIAEVGESLAELMGQRTLSQLALDSVQPDGRVHPEITALQRSGRKCLPITHKLVTRRGLLTWDEVKYGDETLDMRGQWVRVMAVHHYEDQEVLRYQNRAVLLESTPEHKWVQTTESSNMRGLSPIEPKSRRVLQLTPDAYPFDPRELWYPRDLTERERVAALVGLLVTDGRCATRTDSPNSISTHVYQTEGKFYLEMKDVLLEEWIVSDTPRMTDAYTLLHEIRLDSKKMRVLLEAEGLDLSGNLRHSKSVLDWVLTLNNREALAFLTSVWLADGAVNSGGTSISCKKPNLVPAIQMAAYMCGRRSNFREYTNKRDSYVQGVIHITRDRVSVRNLPEPEEVRSDVWCVTTETGTFTAWTPDGPFSAPYLTGNSTTKPGLTVWSSKGDKAIEKSYFLANSDDEMLVGLDYSNADQRIIAALSGDLEYAKRFDEGVDGHEINGRIMFGDEVYDSNPPYYRNEAKAPGHAYTYGAGPGKLSATTGLPYDTMMTFCKGMEKTYPDVAQWQKRVRKEGESGYLTNDWGRRMIVDPGRTWTASPALYGQSGTREIVVDALIRMLYADVKYITWLKAQVHDELIFSVPKSGLGEDELKIREFMSCVWGPSDGTGQGIEFPVSMSQPGRSWMDTNH